MKFAYPLQTQETVKEQFSGRIEDQRTFTHFKNLGYEGVELLVRNVEDLDMHSLVEQLNASGLEVAALSTGPMVADDGLTFAHASNDVREEAVRRCIVLLSWAEYFQCPVTIGKVRGAISDSQPSQSWDRMRRSFERVVNEAEKKKVQILIEPQNQTQMNNLNSIDEVMRFIDEFSSPSLGLMIDSLHLFSENLEGDASKKILQFENSLGFVHLSDSKRHVLGEGEFDLESLMSTLSKVNQDLYVSFEVKQKPGLASAGQCLSHVKTLMST